MKMRWVLAVLLLFFTNLITNRLTHYFTLAEGYTLAAMAGAVGTGQTTFITAVYIPLTVPLPHPFRGLSLEKIDTKYQWKISAGKWGVVRSDEVPPLNDKYYK
jgi:hypothetical protein